MRKIVLCFWIGFVGYHGSSLAIDSDLIRETEHLYNSLSLKDSSRPTMALRLGDLLFDRAILLSKDGTGSAAGVTSLRTRATAYYTSVLSGFDGLFSKPSEAVRHKINFQLARISTDQGDWAKARPLWEGLRAQNELKPLQREACLRLAEAEENSGKPENLVSSLQNYTQALALCEGGDVCSYIHFRRAWVLYRQEKVDEAVPEMELALFDSRKQVREESLRDYINFSAQSSLSAQSTFAKLEEFEQKMGRPELTKNLAEAYFALGRKDAGIFVLDLVNRRHPELKHFARLLEEIYGARDTTRYTEILNRAQEYVSKNTMTGDGGNAVGRAVNLWKNDVETEKILRRLTVQLDGERVSQPMYVESFKDTVEFYLSVFPQSGERQKMIEGWTAAEKNDDVKSKYLATWISEERQFGNKPAEIRWREMKASIEQKSQHHEAVISEMQELLRLSMAPQDLRKYKYVRSKAQYDLKKHDEALVGFRELSQSETIDDWAIQSQNLAMDILNVRRDFAGVVSQADIWLKNENIVTASLKNSSLKSELEDMRKAREQAQFEGAVALGSTPQALAVFMEYCLKKELLPKSCENAKVLAVNTQDQKALITLLKVLGPEDELAAEYEAAGYFVESAHLLRRKLTIRDGRPVKDGALKDYLKISLLYELGGDLVQRDQVLGLLVQRLATSTRTQGSKSKPNPNSIVSSPQSGSLSPDSFQALEALIFRTFDEASMIGPELLSIPWSEDFRLQLADRLELSGKGTKQTTDLLMKTCRMTGEAWKKLTFLNLTQLDKQQAAIKFYGKNGERLFQNRLLALKKLSDRADCLLKDSESPFRVRVASFVERAHAQLVGEIQSSPMPEQLSVEQIEAVKGSLAQLALPIQEKATAYNSIAKTELAKVPMPLQASLEARFMQGTEDATNIDPELGISDTTTRVTTKPGGPGGLTGDVGVHTQVLNDRPHDRVALQKLKDLYQGAGHGRLAAYYEGRLKNLERREQ